MALLEVRSLSKTFGGLVALQSVDLAIDDGMIAALIGPNGAGKTTFFNTLTGHYRPDQGEIRFKNRSLNGVTPDRITHAGICRTFQNTRLFGEMSVLENVLVGMHARIGVGLADILGRSRRFYAREKQAAERAIELLALVGLEGREEEWASSLAYGDQRRLEVARALASQPELLLLDEPTAGMNPSEAEGMMALIERLVGSHVRSILLIEHNMRVVMGVSHRVSVLDYGEKIAEGTPDEVRRDKRVIEAYLGLGKQADHA